MLVYNSYEQLTPKTGSMNFFPTESNRYPVVTLVINNQKARLETPQIVSDRRAGKGNVKMFVTDLGEKSVKTALALINDCPISEVVVQFHDQTDRTKLN